MRYNKNNLINEIKTKMEELKDLMNEDSCNFCDSWEWFEIHYLSDAFSEYADSNCSIYYSDQKESFYKDPERATDLLKEFGYRLEDFGDLEEAICMAGVCLEYDSILNKLYADESTILQYLILSNILYLINNNTYNFIIAHQILKNIDILNLEADHIPGVDSFKDIEAYCGI